MDIPQHGFRQYLENKYDISENINHKSLKRQKVNSFSALKIVFTR